jgi:hypothetical protein
VRAHLAPGGALYVINQAPGWRAPADAEPFAASVAAALAAHGFEAGPPRFAEAEPVVCVVAQPSAPAGSTQRSGAAPPEMP